MFSSPSQQFILLGGRRLWKSNDSEVLGLEPLVLLGSNHMPDKVSGVEPQYFQILPNSIGGKKGYEDQMIQKAVPSDPPGSEHTP